MLSAHASDFDIFVGQNAGDDIYHSVTSAQSSIKIVSPYISSDYVDFLLDASNKGVDVLLLTGSDMANKEEKRAEIYRKIITQHQHLDEEKKNTREKWITFSIILIISSIILGIFGYKTEHKKLLWAFAAAPLFYFLFNSVKQIKIYNYTYDTKFDFGVFVSPYEQQIDNNHFFVHSKLYVIDEKVAFVGSVNFTKVAFRRNYECCVRVGDGAVVAAISEEIDRLTRTEGVFYRNISEIGRLIYPEPPN